MTEEEVRNLVERIELYDKVSNEAAWRYARSYQNEGKTYREVVEKLRANWSRRK